MSVRGSRNTTARFIDNYEYNTKSYETATGVRGSKLLCCRSCPLLHACRLKSKHRVNRTPRLPKATNLVRHIHVA
eukprot:scaffold383007_cov39-Prasinocladus_malaysianus.AAC.1